MLGEYFVHKQIDIWRDDEPLNKWKEKLDILIPQNFLNILNRFVKL